MGSGAAHVSTSIGDALALAASLLHCGFGSPDPPGRKPPPGGSGGDCSLSPEPSAAGAPDPIAKDHKQVPALAAMMDFWWHGIAQDSSPSVFRPCGGTGCTSACFRSSIGHTKWPTHGGRAGKPGSERPWRRCKARFKRMRFSSWPRRFLRSGNVGYPADAGVSAHLVCRGRAQWYSGTAA